MLRPSYSELMKILNQTTDLDDKITSRYAVVIASAKRARQITSGAPTFSYADTDKAISVAVAEMYDGHIRITKRAGGYDELDEAVYGGPEDYDEGYDEMVTADAGYDDIDEDDEDETVEEDEDGDDE